MEPVAEKLAAFVGGLLGPGCLGVCQYGSGAVGPLRPESDIDVLVIAGRSLGDDERRALTTELVRVSGRHAVTGPAWPVELLVVVRDDVVPWRYPPGRDYLYGDWLRDRILAGELPQPAAAIPDLAIVLATALQTNVPLCGAPLADLLDPIPAEDLRRAVQEAVPDLLPDLPGDERNVVLALCRMITTLETGEIVPKDVAAARVAAELDGAERQVAELARRAYLGAGADDWANIGEPLQRFVDWATAKISRACE